MGSPAGKSVIPSQGKSASLCPSPEVAPHLIPGEAGRGGPVPTPLPLGLPVVS